MMVAYVELLLHAPLRPLLEGLGLLLLPLIRCSSMNFLISCALRTLGSPVLFEYSEITLVTTVSLFCGYGHSYGNA